MFTDDVAMLRAIVCLLAVLVLAQAAVKVPFTDCGSKLIIVSSITASAVRACVCPRVSMEACASMWCKVLCIRILVVCL
jgi:hypothetical protein